MPISILGMFYSKIVFAFFIFNSVTIPFKLYKMLHCERDPLYMGGAFEAKKCHDILMA